MSYTVEQFFNKIKPYVVEDMKKSGILASLTAAQALIESSKGNSKLTQNANNLFGIKGTYNGQSVCMLTPEYINHKWVEVYANFRKYPSWAESIADHSAMFNRMARYKNLRSEKNYKRAAKNVRVDGYCTDPNYTQKLISVIERYKLYTWDSVDTAKTVSNTFEKYTGNSTSIVVALTSLGIDSDIEYRKKIAEVNGIKAYKGSAAQNTKLLKLLSEGRLIKP